MDSFCFALFCEKKNQNQKKMDAGDVEEILKIAAREVQKAFEKVSINFLPLFSKVPMIV